MNPFFFHPTNLNITSDQHTLVPIEEHEYNTNEGSEFLDDAIRMQEQPLMAMKKTLLPIITKTTCNNLRVFLRKIN